MSGTPARARPDRPGARFHVAESCTATGTPWYVIIDVRQGEVHRSYTRNGHRWLYDTHAEAQETADILNG